MKYPPGIHTVQPSTMIRVVIDSDPTNGHDIESAHVEQVWLPILGPTAMLLARRLLRAPHDITDYGLADLAHWLGVGYRKIDVALSRLDRFGPVYRFDDEVVIPRLWADPS